QTRRQSTLRSSPVCPVRFPHVVVSVMRRISLRTIACLGMLLGLLGGGFAAADEDGLRKIVIFHPGTSAQVQQQVVTRSESRVLSVLSLVNGMAIELPTQNAAQALTDLEAEPTVAGVYDDPSSSGQDGGGDNVIVITPAEPPVQEFYPWGLDTIHVP